MAQQQNNIAHSTTQLFLDLYDITNDLIILADGATSLVITVSAMNFGLLSENEQDATIYAYAALLNSLSFPIQIVVRSQPKDVTGYLKKIQEQEDKTTNQIYRQKIKEYRAFVESLVQEQNVLDKKFYIVIPLSAVEMGLTTQSVIPGSKNKPLSSFEKNYIIEKAKTNLLPRRDHLIDQLARIGLYSRQLSTQELIQMLYSSYNPESFEGQKVTDTSHYTTPLVQAKIQGDFSMDTQLPTQPSAVGQAQPSTPMSSTPAPATQPTAPITPPMPSTPQTPMVPTTPPLSNTPPVPEFSKTDLGFTTPPAMSTSAPSVETSAAPVTSSVGTPPVMTQPIPPAQTVFETPSIVEVPTVSVPEEKPVAPAAPVVAPVAAAPAAEAQTMINQTLGAMSPNTSSATAPLPQPSIDN